MKTFAIFVALLAVAQVQADRAYSEYEPQFDLAAYENKLEELAKSDGEQQLVEGVTVNKLLAMGLKRLDRKKCSRADLFPRWFACEMLRANGEARKCCVRYLDQVAHYCARENLGQNHDQFDPVRRPFVKWANLRKMNKSEGIFWKGILNFAEGSAEAMWQYLASGLVPEADKKARKPRYEFQIDSDELLGREQLLEMLSTGSVPDTRITLAILSRAKDKETTQLAGGVTVADLLKMNDISQPLCETPDEIVKRNKQCIATQKLASVRNYCSSLVRSMASNCLRGFEDDHFDNWWLGVHDSLRPDMSSLAGFLQKAAALESYLLGDVETWRAKFDYIMSDQFKADQKRRAEEWREEAAKLRAERAKSDLDSGRPKTVQIQE